ncbi:hypothetical protein HHI36_015495 [Cryptolaemus montrouzieri]|uniref:Uncharacterized protein n=1 Tax=Cryptolaemus montrouzieri TaxID=559131 RepID=A0ABD2N6L7_9CUCU
MFFFKRKHTVWPLKLPMFNLYQSVNKKEEDKEPETIGHERWYQERSSRSSMKKRKKRPPRRAQSAAEFSAQTLTAANRRAAFRNRSQSSENKSTESEGGSSVKSSTPLSESFVKVLFPKR